MATDKPNNTAAHKAAEKIEQERLADLERNLAFSVLPNALFVDVPGGRPDLIQTGSRLTPVPDGRLLLADYYAGKPVKVYRGLDPDWL